MQIVGLDNIHQRTRCSDKMISQMIKFARGKTNDKTLFIDIQKKNVFNMSDMLLCLSAVPQPLNTHTSMGIAVNCYVRKNDVRKTEKQFMSLRLCHDNVILNIVVAFRRPNQLTLAPSQCFCLYNLTIKFELTISFWTMQIFADQ